MATEAAPEITCLILNICQEDSSDPFSDQDDDKDENEPDNIELPAGEHYK